MVPRTSAGGVQPSTPSNGSGRRLVLAVSGRAAVSTKLIFMADFGRRASKG